MQLWVLRHKKTGEFLPPKDDDPAGAFMCWPDEAACLEGLAYQLHQDYVNPDEWSPFRLSPTIMANTFLAPSTN
jgi:hypothetical protein